MVYFLVDGGMGDSVQVSCQNVSSISNKISKQQQHIQQRQQPIHIHNAAAKAAATTILSTAASDITTSSSSISSGRSSNADYVLKTHKNSRPSLVHASSVESESDEDEIALYPLSNQVS